MARDQAAALTDAIDYVLDKLKRHDLVMIGERHWVCEEPLFLQRLIARAAAENVLDVIFLEFGNFEDQWKVDAFLNSKTYDPKPIIEVFRDMGGLGWGYQEYLDVFRRVYEVNVAREPSGRIKIVLVDPSFEGIDLWSYFDRHLSRTGVPADRRSEMAGSLYDAIKDRDRVMADVVEAYHYVLGFSHGLFYAGGDHIRKDLRSKDYGRRYYTTGGLLARRYPGRICCLTFHRAPEFWHSAQDFESLEALFTNHGKPFGADTKHAAVARLKLKGAFAPDGIDLVEAYDGYIVLTRDQDYQPCALIPGFYDDAYAKVVWEQLRERGLLKRLPEQWSEWRHKTPTGKELEKMIREGLR